MIFLKKKPVLYYDRVLPGQPSYYNPEYTIYLRSYQKPNVRIFLHAVEYNNNRLCTPVVSEPRLVVKMLPHTNVHIAAAFSDIYLVNTLALPRIIQTERARQSTEHSINGAAVGLPGRRLCTISRHNTIHIFCMYASVGVSHSPRTVRTAARARTKRRRNHTHFTTLATRKSMDRVCASRRARIVTIKSLVLVVCALRQSQRGAHIVTRNWRCDFSAPESKEKKLN